MHCVYNLNDFNYVDIATLRTSPSGSVWCECDVIGVHESGQLGTFLNPIPSGVCILTVTRCPNTLNIIP